MSAAQDLGRLALHLAEQVRRSAGVGMRRLRQLEEETTNPSTLEDYVPESVLREILR